MAKGAGQQESHPSPARDPPTTQRQGQVKMKPRVGSKRGRAVGDAKDPRGNLPPKPRPLSRVAKQGVRSDDEDGMMRMRDEW